MAIRPVSSVSFNNYSNFSNNVAFEGKKNKSPNNRHCSNPMKAIPLATLIAMSPMAFAEEAFSLEPQEPKIENIYAPEQSRVVPLPAKAKILKEFKIDRFEYKLIDFDGDNSDYEVMEYLNYGPNNEIIDRAILKAFDFFIDPKDGQKVVGLYGIGLDEKNLNDYAPKKYFSKSYRSEELYDIYKSVIAMPNNNEAVREISIKDNYSSDSQHGKDLSDYEWRIGI